MGLIGKRENICPRLESGNLGPTATTSPAISDAGTTPSLLGNGYLPTVFELVGALNTTLCRRTLWNNQICSSMTQREP
jgi:hypothetical protein